MFTLLLNVKMPTIVGILTFMSRLNFIFSWVEQGKHQAQDYISMPQMLTPKKIKVM